MKNVPRGLEMAEWRQHWPSVMAAFMGYAFSSSLTYAIALFIEPLSRDFGWSQTQITAGYSLSMIIMIPLSAVAGMAIDKWGSRRVALPGLLLVSLSLAALSLANGSSLQWLALWSVYGITASIISTTVWTCIVIDGFKVNRSFALSIVLSGAPFASAVAPPLAQWLVDSFGWRNAFLSFGFGWGGISLVLALLFIPHRRTTVHRGDATVASNMPGLTVKDAARSIQLFRIALAALITVTLGASLAVYWIQILKEIDVPRIEAARLAALSGVAGIIGKIVTGWAMQKWDPGLIGSLSIGGTGLALALIILPSNTGLLMIFTAILLGFTGGAKIQIVAYLTSIYAGVRNFGKIFGVMSSMIAIAAAIGPVLGGIIHDITKSYYFLILGGVSAYLLAAALVFRLGPHPDWRESARLP
ncbi:MAG: MFS transporter [Hyphomicrobiales bacterium]|nr:MFS transporter [Hyphomicrobiales bacterium]